MGKHERALGLASLESDAPGIALGTAFGVVKRLELEPPSNRERWDLIALKDGDQVVGFSAVPTDGQELVFVTSDGQLLHFPAAAVRPQGRAAGGMSGVRVSAESFVVFFGAVDAQAENSVVTVAGSSAALPGTDAGYLKVSAFSEFPAKGRGTGGVRCHRFLRGVDTLILAWVGPEPAIAAAATGVAVELPSASDKRDGSGSAPPQSIAAVSTRAPR